MHTYLCVYYNNYKIIHMYVLAQHSPNHLYYVHKNLSFSGGGKGTFAFHSEKFPLPLLEIQYLPPL